MRSAAQSILADLAGALGLLTRLPVGWLHRAAPDLARSVWAYPLVGAAVGAVGAGLYAAAVMLRVPPVLAACWAAAAGLAVTGALHEDGLADTADGFGGGRDRARKLEIMRDSRIGSFGALALMLALAVRVGAVAALAQPGAVLAALVATGVLGRAAILGLLWLGRPARPDGLAVLIGRPPAGSMGAGLLVAGAAPFLLLPSTAAGGSVLAAAAVCALLLLLARRQVGGYTGDVLGAASVVTECAVLTLLAAWGS